MPLLQLCQDHSFTNSNLKKRYVDDDSLINSEFRIRSINLVRNAVKSLQVVYAIPAPVLIATVAKKYCSSISALV